jgi:hypothetical protein
MTWPIASGSLVLGFGVAELTGVRPLGGIVLVIGCGWCALQWLHTAGRARTAALVFIYLAMFALSHYISGHGPKLGAWPSVFVVSAITGLAVYALADARAGRVARR